MGSFPQDFVPPVDQGGPGQGQPVGGFGGNSAKARAHHRAVAQRVGKAPVLLIHGNSGAADSGQWDMLDLKAMLTAAGYPQEIIWAPSYLGAGALDLVTPHTNNVNEVREFIDRVCEYLEVEVVDVVAHSLGCTLVYAICRGLEKQTTPVNWNQPKQWHRLGTFVALAGAFHGLGSNSVGEWKTGAEFLTELLTERLGDGGETPYGQGKPKTPGPVPHNITYYCGVARGDFIDQQLPGTGTLEGAINRFYDLGPSTTGHEKIKENRAVFDDFSRHLNSVPPAPSIEVKIDKDSGGYASPLTVTVAVAPPDTPVAFAANRVTKQLLNGAVADKVHETLQGSLQNGQSLALSTNGMWEITFSVAGAADDIHRTYWVGVEEIRAVIVTDSSTPFEGSVVVMATTSSPRATLHHSLDGRNWNEGASVVLTEDAVAHFIAIEPEGIASLVVSKAFKRRVAWEDAVTANANQHFLAARIGVDEYLAYSRQFGFFTPITLYLVHGEWVLDPNQPRAALVGILATATQEAATVTAPAHIAGARPVIRVSDGDPQPGAHPSPVTITVEASHERDEHVTVHYTLDGSLPDQLSPSFVDRQRFELSETGNHVISCYAVDSQATEMYEAFHYTITR